MIRFHVSIRHKQTFLSTIYVFYLLRYTHKRIRQLYASYALTNWSRHFMKVLCFLCGQKFVTSIKTERYFSSSEKVNWFILLLLSLLTSHPDMFLTSHSRSLIICSDISTYYNRCDVIHSTYNWQYVRFAGIIVSNINLYSDIIALSYT